MTTTKIRLLSWLKAHKDQWVPGEGISASLGISRTAVWKQINNLKAEGHRIQSVPRKGYRLTAMAELMAAEQIQAHLQTRILGRPALEVLKAIDSTNLRAKALAGQGAAEGTVVVADAQTHGRGRRGRTWFSPPGRSLYASIVLRPPLAPAQAPQITLMTAVAVAKCLQEAAQLDARIKWPNDILVGDKKIAGILTEISTEMDMVDYVVVGLGINVNTRRSEMPEEIQEIATSVAIETGQEANRAELLCKLLSRFEACYDLLKTSGFGPVMAQWREMTDIIGQHVYVDVLDKRHTGVVAFVDDDGVLVLKDHQGQLHRIFSGDVTRIRPE